MRCFWTLQAKPSGHYQRDFFFSFLASCYFTHMRGWQTRVVLGLWNFTYGFNKPPCAKKFPLVLMGGGVTPKSVRRLGARTPPTRVEGLYFLHNSYGVALTIENLIIPMHVPALGMELWWDFHSFRWGSSVPVSAHWGDPGKMENSVLYFILMIPFIRKTVQIYNLTISSYKITVTHISC